MKICSKVINVSEINQGYSIRADGTEIRMLFMTDDIIRIRAGFDGDFAEESYSLVMTAWKDRMDSFMGNHRKTVQPKRAAMCETEQKIILQGSKLRVEIEKDPFRICIYDKNDICLHADIVDLGFQEDSNHRRIHTSEIFDGDCFYGFGEKTGEINKHKKFMCMSPKDSLGYDPKETDWNVIM